MSEPTCVKCGARLSLELTPSIGSSEIQERKGWCVHCVQQLEAEEARLPPSPLIPRVSPITPLSTGHEDAPTIATPRPIEPLGHANEATPRHTPSQTLNAAAREFFGGQTNPLNVETSPITYRTLQKLADWRFGTCQLAEHSQLKRTVRLIVLEKPWSDIPEIREWFLDVSRNLAGIHHPSLDCSVLEVIDNDFTAICVSEREFAPPNELIQQAKKDPYYENGDLVAKTLLDLLQGLQMLHESNVYLGEIGTSHLGWQSDQNRMVLRPFQKGIPGANLIDETGKRLAPIAKIIPEEQKRLAQSLTYLFQPAMESSQSVVSRYQLRESLPTLRPFLARLLHRLANRGVPPKRYRGIITRLGVMAQERVFAVDFGRRILTFLLEMSIFWSSMLFLWLAWLIASIPFLNEWQSHQFKWVQLAYSTLYFIGLEFAFGMRPAGHLQGMQILGPNACQASPLRRLLRASIRFAIIMSFGALSSAIYWIADVPSKLPEEVQIAPIMPFILGSGIGSLAILFSHFMLRGRCIHDWLSQTHLIHFTTELQHRRRVASYERRAISYQQPIPIQPLLGSFAQQQVGPYVLETEIGRGGMGTVYRAIDETLNRPVALKVVSNAGNDNEGMIRFQREAQLAANLDHPHIAKVYSVGLWEDLPYMAMEYVEGENLHQVVSKQGPLSVARAWDAIQQAALGLQAASEQSIVHRDIKPSNLMITSHGIVKLMDFGISKLQHENGDVSSLQPLLLSPTQDVSLTRTGSLMGTPQYMSPEQTRGETLDARSDIYSLGLTLYYLLSGKSPYEGSQLYDLIIKQCTEPLPPLPPHLLSHAQAKVLDRMLAKDPKDRYQDYATLIEDLQSTFPDLPHLAESYRRIFATLIDISWATLLYWFVQAVASPLAPLATLATFALLAWMMRTYGTTPAKWLLSLRVVSANGTPLNWWQASLRTAFKQLPSTFHLLVSPFLWLAPSSQVSIGFMEAGILIFNGFAWLAGLILMEKLEGKQAVHDLLCKTRVLVIPSQK